MSEEEPWSRKDSNHLASLIVVVGAIGGVIGFLIWLNRFIDGIGFWESRAAKWFPRRDA